ncbi:hypothetical protein AcW1_006651 [Taiwanofungus camphoratus]|nr:hypothetical protein AcV7_007419 [Antrodia cinnamomea]KAI0954894.1 hypothetical protein AcW1_006651 [Antrodia cinnamomea]
MTLATYSSALGFSPSPNMNILIAHIPDDVLQEIFLLLAWDIDSPPISKRALKNGFTWLSVSYVCSYWRRLALGSPRLWALINVYEESSLGMVREFLKRSRDLSLCVRFEDHPSFHSERGLDLLQLLITKYRPIESTAMLDKLIAGHSNRIMEFQLVSTRVNTILSSFTSPAPRLRVLDLQSSWPPKPIPTIPFFVNQSPLLHVVRAHKVILPWYPFRNLTEMDIEYDRPPAMDALLQILHDCSSLIVLKLDIQRAILRTSYPQDSSNIELAYLEGLTLSATYDDLAYILSRLSFPATVQIELAFNGDPKVDDVEPCPALLDIAIRPNFIPDAMDFSREERSRQAGAFGTAPDFSCPAAPQHQHHSVCDERARLGVHTRNDARAAIHPYLTPYSPLRAARRLALPRARTRATFCAGRR